MKPDVTVETGCKGAHGFILNHQNGRQVTNRGKILQASFTVPSSGVCISLSRILV